MLNRACALLVIASSVAARGQEAPVQGSMEGPPAKAAVADLPKIPRVGGHFGLALPLFAFDNDGTTVIGRDFVQVGITPGITVKVSDRWAVDFEFIAFSRWDLNGAGKPDKSHTILVVDPGVVYNFGPVAGGLRLATQIGEGVPLNVGIVPIVVVPFKLTTRLSYFVELDLPVFVTASPGTPATALAAAVDDRVIGSLTILFQTGFAF
jgi:hypothetical protein